MPNRSEKETREERSEKLREICKREAFRRTEEKLEEWMKKEVSAALESGELGSKDGKSFRCAQCSGIFEITVSEEKVQARRAANGWTDVPDDVMARVCARCYAEVMIRLHN